MYSGNQVKIMRNYRNNNKRNRFRNNGLNKNINGHRNTNNFSNVSEFQRKHLGKNSHSIQKLIEKYTDLGKEAISKGDKILSENYFQHADHFIRVINEREIENKEKNVQIQKEEKSVTEENPTD